MDWKEKITKYFNEVVNGLDKEFTSVNNTLEDLKANYGKSIVEYAELQKEISDSRSEMAKREAEVNNLFAKLEKEQKLFNDERDRFYLEATKINEELIAKRDEILSLDKQIQEKKSDLKAVEAMTKQKDILAREIANMAQDLSDKSVKVREVESKIETLKSDYEKQSLIFNQANADQIEKLSKSLKDVIDRESKVSFREKAAEQKEADLATVEKRWKKLYEDKGAGFKV